MITCPWCGTNYLTFQSNCKNCGGPLPLPTEPPIQEQSLIEVEESLPVPPPPPRPISDSFAWRLAFTSKWGLAGAIVGFIGAVFMVLGFILTVAIVTAFVGLPFLGLGLVMFGIGLYGVLTSYSDGMKVVQVLRSGEAARGRITDLSQDTSVEINNRHPWVIHYDFQTNDNPYSGTITTMNDLPRELLPGRAVCVLYNPQDPTQNSLYPHP